MSEYAFDLNFKFSDVKEKIEFFMPVNWSNQIVQTIYIGTKDSCLYASVHVCDYGEDEQIEYSKKGIHVIIKTMTFGRFIELFEDKDKGCGWLNFPEGNWEFGLYDMHDTDAWVHFQGKQKQRGYGPFNDELIEFGEPFFATAYDLVELYFLGNTSYSHSSDHRNYSYHILIPSQLCQISNVSRKILPFKSHDRLEPDSIWKHETEELVKWTIELQNHGAQNELHILFYDQGDQIVESTTEDSLTIETTSTAVLHKVLIIDSESNILDMFTPRISSRFPFHSSYIGQVTDEEMHAKTLLDEVQDKGEGLMHECKPYIRLELGKGNGNKHKELARTICAFSNRMGGSLFIGVSDELNISGCKEGLTSEPSLKYPSLEEKKNQYASDIVRFINELVVSDVQDLDIKTYWADVALDCVLILQVAPSSSLFVYKEGNQFYSRRGSSNAAITSAEVEAIVREKLDVQRFK